MHRDGAIVVHIQLCKGFGYDVFLSTGIRLEVVKVNLENK